MSLSKANGADMNSVNDTVAMVMVALFQGISYANVLAPGLMKESSHWNLDL